jgi:ADP-ribose pyrophosphatase YjhB (NUDIX family)
MWKRDAMKYCSECGIAIARTWIAHEGRERCICPSCRIIHYENPRVIVGCMVFWRCSILMCRRSQEPARGQWTIPSGFLECGETLEEGAARETFEETGVLIDPAGIDLCSILNMTAIKQVAISFRTELTSAPSIRPGSECLEVAFMTEKEVADEEIAWRGSTGGGGAQRLFNELRSGNFTIQLATMGTSQGIGFRSRKYRIAPRAAATSCQDLADQRIS